MSTTFDIFLACAPKDYKKLPYVVSSIDENIKGFDNIFVVSPYDIPGEIRGKIPIMVYHYIDDNALPGVSRDKWQFRPNWCFQQHLKLFQQITKDWYLTIDCDIIINRPMTFFEKSLPIWYHGLDQNYPPYFNFMKEMIGLEKVYPHTFIADMNLFNRKLINDMLERHGFTVESFIKKSQAITRRDCHIGEPELYGNFCAKHYPNFYINRDLAQAPFIGRFHNKNIDSVYSEDEIKGMITQRKSELVDVFSMHSWLDEGDQIK